MADIAFIPILDAGLQLPGYDISLSGPDLLADTGLRTSVIISLFSDRLAEPDDVLPDDSGDRRGYWADALASVEGDRIGSRLWLLSREKQTNETLNRAREYAEEALQWLVDDGVAQSVHVNASWVRSGMLGLIIDITRPDGGQDSFRFEAAWNGELNAV